MYVGQRENEEGRPTDLLVVAREREREKDVVYRPLRPLSLSEGGESRNFHLDSTILSN